MDTDPRTRAWAEQLAAATPALDHEQQRIALHIYQLIAATAQPVTVAQIADVAGISEARVKESVRSWPLVLWDDQDRMIGFWGIHAKHITPTHALEVDGTMVYGWCAWDTLFITELLGRHTRVTSTDPNNKSPVELSVSPNGVASVDPAGAVVSLILPEDGLTDDAIQQFCHKVHFFTSSESAEKWIADRPGMFSVTVDEAFQLGQAANRLRMGSVLGATPGEAD